MKLSIVVCTYNRAESLQETLSALIQQQHSLAEIDILVVDNNSTDETKDVIASMQQASPLPLRYLFEARQGLSYARNRAAAASDADVVLFIDDDASPVHQDWAERIAQAFNNDQVGAGGGDAIAQWPATGRPQWLHDQLLSYLGIVDFGHASTTDLRYPHFPYGVNIAFRRETLIELGGFSAALGRSGDTLLSGEETELCRRINATGQRVVFVPKASVRHRMAPERLNKDWFLSRARAQGESKATIEWDDGPPLSTTWRVSKRLAILAGSYATIGASAIAFSPSLTMVARSKATMSLAYLRTAYRLNRRMT